MPEDKPFAVCWYDPFDGAPDISQGRFYTPQQAADSAIHSSLKYGFEGYWEVWHVPTSKPVPKDQDSKEGSF